MCVVCTTVQLVSKRMPLAADLAQNHINVHMVDTAHMLPLSAVYLHRFRGRLIYIYSLEDPKNIGQMPGSEGTHSQTVC